MKKFTEEEVKSYVKKAIWDYVQGNGELKDTDFHFGISTEFKTPQKMNIDAWWERQKKRVG